MKQLKHLKRYSMFHATLFSRERSAKS